MWLLMLLALAVGCLVRLWLVLPARVRAPHSAPAIKARTASAKTLVVLGSGGHTAEMLTLIEKLDAKRYSPLLFVVAKSDSTSRKRVEATHATKVGASWVAIIKSLI